MKAVAVLLKQKHLDSAIVLAIDNTRKTMINKNAAHMKHLVISPLTMTTITTWLLHHIFQDSNEDIHTRNWKKNGAVSVQSRNEA